MMYNRNIYSVTINQEEKRYAFGGNIMMLWKALGILTMVCSSCTLLWWLWTTEVPFAKIPFWIIVVALIICAVNVIKGLFSE